ncbi:hypothetical protein R6Q59_014822 [Mikania micrantha]
MNPSVGGHKPSISQLDHPPDVLHGDVEATASTIAVEDTGIFSIVPKLFGYVDGNEVSNHGSNQMPIAAEDELQLQSSTPVINNPKLPTQGVELQPDVRLGGKEGNPLSPPKLPAQRLGVSGRKTKNPIRIQGFRGIRRERRTTRYS